jgi:hypothetical protein
MINKQIILGLLIGVVSVYTLSTIIVTEKLKTLRVDLDSKIESQLTLIKEMATTLGRGAANEKISAVIPECPADEASQYDRLLSSLDKGLTKAEIQGLNILFKRCGSIPASRRAGMAMLFEREVFFYGELITQRTLLGDYKIEEANLAKWNTLAEREKEISSLFFKLVDSQRQIISTLEVGGSPSSIESIQNEAGKTQGEMSSVTESAFELRTALTTP